MRRTALVALSGSILVCGLAAGARGCAQDAEAAPASTSRQTGGRAGLSPSASAACAPSAAPSVAGAPATRQPPSEPEKELAVKRLVVTKSMNGREPAPVQGALRIDQSPVVAFVELLNPDRLEHAITVSFVRGGVQPVTSVELGVPAGHARWRTWAESRRQREPGSWDAVVSTRAGKELARSSFELHAPAGRDAR